MVRVILLPRVAAEVCRCVPGMYQRIRRRLPSKGPRNREENTRRSVCRFRGYPRGTIYVYVGVAGIICGGSVSTPGVSVGGMHCK